MMLIEKMGDKLTPETFKNGIMYRPSLYSFGGLRIGCLLLGLGAGLLVGYMLACTTQPDYLSDNYPYTVKEAVSIIYGACVLLGGGLGLVISYLIEKNNGRKISKNCKFQQGGLACYNGVSARALWYDLS